MSEIDTMTDLDRRNYVAFRFDITFTNFAGCLIGVLGLIVAGILRDVSIANMSLGIATATLVTAKVVNG